MQLTEETKENIEFNEQFKLAYDYCENSVKNIFITGKAGTGKSTLLKFVVSNTAKNIAVLAPTGVAAVNIKGQTIHSFFKFKLDVTPDSVESMRVRKKAREIYKKVDTIIIDEISMVRSDLLDCIDRFLRIYGKCPGLSFGGVQMIFFGDLFQLPPVVTNRERNLFNGVYNSPYFFDAKVFHDVLGKPDHPQRLHFIKLKKIYRQKEEDFIRLLSSVRTKSISHDELDKLNSRCLPEFTPSIDDFYVYLTTTNAMADRINQERLQHLDADEYVLDGDILGDFERNSLPTSDELNLKCGAQVMLLNNESTGRWVNGSIGRIIAIDPEQEIVSVELSSGTIVDVGPYIWEMYKFSYNEETEKIESESVGSFEQYPLKLSWAVTIHKSQGKTFSKVVVDIGSGTFSHGQMYVALSRCESFEGLVLRRKIFRNHILVDTRVEKFMDGQSQANKNSGITVS